MKPWLNAANLFTAVRVVLAPLTIRSILRQQHEAALTFFLCAALTDGLDGFLARRLGCMTQVGAYLDPLADKLLLSGTYLALAAISSVPAWFVVLVFGRDLLILGGAAALFLVARRRRFPPTPWGKLSTFFQILYAVTVLVANAMPSEPAGGWQAAVLWPASLATAWSGIHYAWQTRTFRSLITSNVVKETFE
ncbi:MAG: CDP-alcohol phosphatidyltransferase family protein [Bryobacterales bacterium]|nr:CDP-alcohol phosphatidyltransferase family protein [Bryobacterales bacterium]